MAQIYARSGAFSERGGLAIETGQSFQYQVVEGDGEWLVDIDEDSAFWFNLNLGIVVDGERVPLLPIITKAIRSAAPDTDLDLSAASVDKLNVGGKFYAHLKDGRLLALPFERVKDIMCCLTELLDINSLSPDGDLNISIPQVTALTKIKEADHYNWQGAQSERLLQSKSVNLKFAAIK